MAQLKRLKRTFDIVKELLESDARYRDNDELLVTRFWYDETKLMNINVKSITGEDFMVMYKEGKLTSADCITRARRKVNEMHSHTQGKSYKRRKGALQKQAINELISM